MTPNLRIFAFLALVGPLSLGACLSSDDDAVPGDGDAGPAEDPCPDGDDPITPAVPPEIDGQIVINEFMAHNAATIFDDSDTAHDWVELYNPTDQDIPLHGYGLTDNLAEPNKEMIGADVVLPAGGYLILWLDGEGITSNHHVCFRLGQESGELGLARPDGSIIDRVTYGAQATDFSAARLPDGSDHWAIEWHASPGSSNPDGPGQPVGPEGTDPEVVPAAEDLSEIILGYDRILEIEIVLPPEGVQALAANPREYTPGHLVYDGRTYGPVGVRLKGMNSFEPIDQKPSFRINIDEYLHGAKFFTLDDMTLNNMNNDFSMMHERMAYMVARMAGPASRANHAFVTFNGQPYGLYTNVETVKWHMVSRWFDDATGPLFEATDVDFSSQYISSFEHESGPDDRSLLQGLADALASSSNADQAISQAAEYVAIDQFQRFWAMCAVIGQFDSFPYSNPGDDYFVYADPTTNKLHFMPWGMDETHYSSDHDVNQITSALAVNCFNSPSCYQGFVDRTWELLAETEAFDVVAEHQRIREQIAPYVLQDTNKAYDNAMVTEYQNQMGYFLAERRVKLEGMLPPPSQ